MRLRYLFVCTVTVMSTSVACGNLDTVDNVHDLRLLAIRADPPEQAFELAAASDAVSDSTSSSAPAAATPAVVTLTALVADPRNAGRPITYSLATCAALDANSQRCLEQSPNYQVLTQGVTAATPGWVEISVNFTATPALLSAVAAADRYGGLEGLRLPLQFIVGAGTERVVGTKLVVYSRPRGPTSYVPNVNPIIEGVRVDGQLWDVATTMPFQLSAVPKSGWDITPTFDPALQVPYAALSFTGGIINLQEAWVFDYFSTWGGFSKTHAGGFSAIASAVAPTDSFWHPATSASLGPGLFWFVVRDGRGGTNWLMRHAELLP